MNDEIRGKSVSKRVWAMKVYPDLSSENFPEFQGIYISI